MESEEGAFKSLKTILEECAASISEVQAKYIKSDEQIFNLLKTAKVNFQVLKGLKKGITIVEWLKSHFS